MNPTIHVLAEHQHTVLDEPSDTFRTIHVQAVDQPIFGPSVRLGEWSMTADDARLLATKLLMCADEIEEN